jgi:hypothetical protein
VRHVRARSLISLADEAGHGLQALRGYVDPLSGNETCLLNRATQLLKRAAEVIQCFIEPHQRLPTAIGVKERRHHPGDERHDRDAGPYVSFLHEIPPSAE